MMFCKWCGARTDGAACPECGRSSESPRGGVSLGDFLFMRPVLEAISRGRFFRAVVAGWWRVGAVLGGAGGLILWLMTWKQVFELPPLGIVGGFFAQMLLLVGLYMVVHEQLIRAEEVDALPDSEFTVIPILSIMLRMVGEQVLIIATVLGTGGFLLATFAGSALRRTGIDFPMDASFLGGLVFLLLALAIGIAALFLFYFLAESLRVLVAIAGNTAAIREVAAQWDQRRSRG